ncbi:SDR family NAD(P)-dependent oxidoreductase [Curtobacterium sp. MCPF17_046]|uniref:SDR family NAD(P)-dependent oxidoreductase n=1 Tax=Curtobacterium sp. MCPF17_046 TaxID=2175663 RepID=UPI000D8C304B|nr:SDR family oxidoreductase [Curtobacterium sp. MCPF17_046]PYY39698.1 SDR family NAD(P)-dependent oxidoreductase [Curtobacterium sp. MCPF17_046]
MVQQGSAVNPAAEPQIALVTGSSGGIGAAVVAALQARGDVVIGADRAPLDGQSIDGFYELDVTDEQQIGQVVRDVAATHGRINVLVHAAGVLGGTPDPLVTTTEEFERIMRINATGTFTITRDVANLMRDSGTKGTILLLSSVAAKEARVDYLPYNASKIAVLHIMWSMAKILGPNGVSVNAVNPGPVNTPMWSQLADQAGAAQAARDARAAQLPMQRFAEPTEVANTIAFLTDPANRYITGVSLDVAGGAHLGIGS